MLSLTVISTAPCAMWKITHLGIYVQIRTLHLPKATIWIISWSLYWKTEDGFDIFSPTGVNRGGIVMGKNTHIAVYNKSTRCVEGSIAAWPGANVSTSRTMNVHHVMVILVCLDGTQGWTATVPSPLNNFRSYLDSFVRLVPCMILAWSSVAKDMLFLRVMIDLPIVFLSCCGWNIPEAAG